MKIGTYALAGAVALTVVGCTSKEAPPPAPASAPAPVAEKKAEATLAAKSGSGASGTVEFVEKDGEVTMTVHVSGLSEGEHAIHLHENGDCSAADASSAGGHWNPTGAQHGKWGVDGFHHGDIGNLTADADGHAMLTFSTDLWSIGGDPGTDVVGKAVVVHEKVDDFTSQPSGNAGARVACGVIEAK